MATYKAATHSVALPIVIGPAFQSPTTYCVRPPHPHPPPAMCCWRRVRNTFLVCGHSYDLPEEEIKCSNARCRFSDYHDPNCVEPECRRTCHQYHTFPEVYNPQINRLCPVCYNTYQTQQQAPIRR